MATGPGPVGFRHGSDSLSTIQGGADQLLADGEVRPFSPGYGPAANPGESLWVDPNAAPAGTSPFGLDDACVDEDYQDPNMAAPSGAFMLDDEWWKKVGLDGPITMEQVQGLTAALAAKVSLTAFNALVADFEQHLLDANEGGVTIEQVNAAIAAAVGTVVADVATLSSQVSGLATDVGGLDTTVTGLSGDVNGLITAVAGKQAHSAELDILAALTSTPVGRQMLTAASFDAMKALLSLDAVANTAPADLPVSTATSTAILAAIATAAGDATTKANAAQAAAISAASTDATTKADAKVADAINDGVTTVAPSQNAVFDALATKADLAALGVGWRKVDLQTAASAASSLSANLGVAGALKYRIHWRARSTANAVSATAGLRINSSSASDYTTAGAALTTSGYFGLMAGSQTNSDRWGAGVLEITPGPVAANAWSLLQGLESRVNSTATVTSTNSPIHGAWRDSVGAGMSTIQMIPSAGNLDVGSFMYVEVLL